MLVEAAPLLNQPSDDRAKIGTAVTMGKGNYEETLLSETRQELGSADAKASILLAASGIAFLALLTAGSAATWYPDRLHQHVARIADWLAILFMLGGVSCVAGAVKPRLREKHSRTPKPFYFADVEAYRPSQWRRLVESPSAWHRQLEEGHARFVEALGGLTAEDLASRDADQIWQLSHIAYRKYRLLAIGIWFYGGGIVAGLIALIVEKQWL